MGHPSCNETIAIAQTMYSTSHLLAAPSWHCSPMHSRSWRSSREPNGRSIDVLGWRPHHSAEDGNLLQKKSHRGSSCGRKQKGKHARVSARLRNAQTPTPTHTHTAATRVASISPPASFSQEICFQFTKRAVLLQVSEPLRSLSGTN